MERLSAPERTREELRALMNGDLGTAAGRSDLVRLALRLIVEEVLEGEVADVLRRERYERGDGEKAGYRNGYRPGKVKTAEGAVGRCHANQIWPARRLEVPTQVRLR
jgi:putative transposase